MDPFPRRQTKNCLRQFVYAFKSEKERESRSLLTKLIPFSFAFADGGLFLHLAVVQALEEGVKAGQRVLLVSGHSVGGTDPIPAPNCNYNYTDDKKL